MQPTQPTFVCNLQKSFPNMRVRAFVQWQHGRSPPSSSRSAISLCGARRDRALRVMCFLPSFSTLEVVLWLVFNSKTTTRPLSDFVDDVVELDSCVAVLVSAMIVSLFCVTLGPKLHSASPEAPKAVSTEAK
ncbi:hypothetical protein EDB81DRAFT_764959 [Dactylonectria macrodidyma]|uniref:Uncharacterized protein n=1 Tax=Dactylonectria macrodidyma TaxID=307937 RepID=A0A9P9DVL7_9HYPO|nr:hypothetical protein EDB81DRAFT_764959 [Dactylonectria macrodidyma]